MKIPVAVLVALVGCHGSDSKKTRRTGSAAPVEMITAPDLGDGGVGTSGGGASVDEIEPNDGEDVATPLALGATARGKIDPETDADFYRLDVDKSGALQVSLSGIEGADLSLELLDASGVSLGKSDRGGARVREGIPNAGVTKGRYTLVVRQIPKKKPRTTKSRKGAALADAAVAAAPIYELTAQLVAPPAGAERESDDDRGTANDLIVADNATGYIGWSGDKDVWKLSVETLSGTNVLDVAVSAVDGVALELEVADALGKPLATRRAPRGQPVVLKSLWPAILPGAAPFLYLTVKGTGSNPETAYTLHGTPNVLGPDAELEPNDTLDHTQLIAPDRTVVHATWTAGDVDCFAIAASHERTVTLTVEPSADLDVVAELLIDDAPVSTANKGRKGAAETVTADVPAGKNPILRVKNPDANAMGEGTYDVTVSESAGTGDNAP